MAKVTFSSKWGKVKVEQKTDATAREANKSAAGFCPGDEGCRKAAGRRRLPGKIIGYSWSGLCPLRP